MNTKPFNLADALAGKPVVTRDGRKVIKVIDTGANASYPIVVVVKADDGSERIRTCTRDGSWTTLYRECDLFMAPPTVTKYVNLYHNSSGPFLGLNLFDTEEGALEATKTSGRRSTTYKITWEE